MYKDAPVVVDLDDKQGLAAGSSDDDDDDTEPTPEQENLNSVLNHFGGE